MKLLRLIKRDFAEGTVHVWYKFSLAVVIAVLGGYTFYRSVFPFMESGIYSNPTCMDYLLYIMQGMPVYTFSPTEIFCIPINWFTLQMGIAYIIAYYPEMDFRNRGKQIFVAVKARSRWWLSKCIWVACNVILYFLIMCGSVILFSLFCGAERRFSFSEDIMVMYFGSNMQYMRVADIWLLVFVLPCIMTVSVSVLQVLCSFLISPVISFAGVCGLYVLSAYYTNPFLVGSYTMWQRSDYFAMGGVNMEIGFILAGIIGLGSILAGNIFFDKCDII